MWISFLISTSLYRCEKSLIFGQNLKKSPQKASKMPKKSRKEEKKLKIYRKKTMIFPKIKTLEKIIRIKKRENLIKKLFFQTYPQVIHKPGKQVWKTNLRLFQPYCLLQL